MASGQSRHALILAAGKGTRFKSEKPKVLHSICGKPMIEYLLDRLPQLGVEKTVIVVGQGSEQVEEALTRYPVEFVHQDRQLGTGHAVLSALPALEGLAGSVIVLYGDTPLIQTSALSSLFEMQESSGADEVLLTAILDDPTGYGRILRNESGEIQDIVEEKETTADQKLIQEVNAGFVCFKISALRDHLPLLTCENASGEYYLTDMVKVLRQHRRQVETVTVPVAESEIFGINDRQQLADAALKLRVRINQGLMDSGVTILDPGSTYIDSTVRVGPDSVIHPGAIIEGDTTIGPGCSVGPYVHLVNASVGADSRIDHCSVIRDAEIGSESTIGPFAHLRGGCHLGRKVRIGNFVEVKKSRIGDGTKASHLTYLGDAEIGKAVNIGAGTITCNYDGEKKHRTEIGDGAFIGSDSQLIAPVSIGQNAWVAAGSTITEDVPDDSLAIARSRQTNKTGWSKSRK